MTSKDGLTIRGLPMAPPSGLMSALRLRFSEEPKKTAARLFNDPVQMIQLKSKGRTRLGVDRAKKIGMGLKGSRLSVVKRKGISDQVVANWNALEQRLVWTVDAPSAGTYRVRLRIACPKPFDGSTFVVKGPQDALTGTVKATPSYADFRWISVGTMRLPQGMSRLTLYPTEMPYGYVFGHIAGMDLALI